MPDCTCELRVLNIYVVYILESFLKVNEFEGDTRDSEKISPIDSVETCAKVVVSQSIGVTPMRSETALVEKLSKTLNRKVYLIASGRCSAVYFSRKKEDKGWVYLVTISPHADLKKAIWRKWELEDETAYREIEYKGDKFIIQKVRRMEQFNAKAQTRYPYLYEQYNAIRETVIELGSTEDEDGEGFRHRCDRNFDGEDLIEAIEQNPLIDNQHAALFDVFRDWGDLWEDCIDHNFMIYNNVLYPIDIIDYSL